MKTIYKATLETRNFLFEAYGTTKQDAEVQLGLTLVKHGMKMGLPMGWHNEYVEEIKAVAFELGCGYRDGVKL